MAVGLTSFWACFEAPCILFVAINILLCSQHLFFLKDLLLNGVIIFSIWLAWNFFSIWKVCQLPKSEWWGGPGSSSSLSPPPAPLAKPQHTTLNCPTLHFNLPNLTTPPLTSHHHSSPPPVPGTWWEPSKDYQPYFQKIRWGKVSKILSNKKQTKQMYFGNSRVHNKIWSYNKHL